MDCLYKDLAHCVMPKNLVNAHTPKLPLKKTATDGDKDSPYNINNNYYFNNSPKILSLKLVIFYTCNNNDCTTRAAAVNLTGQRKNNII